MSSLLGKDTQSNKSQESGGLQSTFIHCQRRMQTYFWVQDSLVPAVDDCECRKQLHCYRQADNEHVLTVFHDAFDGKVGILKGELYLVTHSAVPTITLQKVARYSQRKFQGRTW